MPHIPPHWIHKGFQYVVAAHQGHRANPLNFFTARCYAERSIAVAKSSASPSVRDVEVSWLQRLEFFQNNFTVS